MPARPSALIGYKLSARGISLATNRSRSKISRRPRILLCLPWNSTAQKVPSSQLSQMSRHLRESTHQLLNLLKIQWPIIQAPMAGVSSPKMAAAVSNAGGLGSIALGASNAVNAAETIRQVQSQTSKPFNVNLFCHQPAHVNIAANAAWINRLKPLFAKYDAEPPTDLSEIYKSFISDDAMLNTLLATRPNVVSFHFGLPPAAYIHALKSSGTILFCTATNLEEANTAQEAGIDAIVAQGREHCQRSADSMTERGPGPFNQAIACGFPRR